MAIEGVDYSVARPSPAELYKAGKRFAVRYLYGTAAGKAVTRAEVDRLHAAGLAVVLNWEWQADEAKGGFSIGQDRARRTAEAVKALGAPSSAVVYFSVDSDTITTAQARDYFRGVTSVWPKTRTGVYGGRRIVTAAKDEGWCPWLWQTYAWSGGVWVPGTHLQQYRNGVNFQGSDLDLDRALVANYGQWTGQQPPPAVEGDKMLLIKTADDQTVWRSDGLQRVAMTRNSALQAMVAVGHKVVVVANLAELEDAAGPVWTLPEPGDDVDPQAVAAAVLTVLTPQAIAAAVPAEFADQVADELAARLQT